MTIQIDALSCLNLLVTQKLRNLDDLPDAVGIYALGDHLGQLHYIGMTAPPKNFRDRIFQRHINGSEKNSHKLACNYNVGRMWRDKDHPAHVHSDAQQAKNLRKEFIRRYCKVAYVELEMTTEQIKDLEKNVISMADPTIKDWNGTRERVSTFPEPTELINVLLVELGWSAAQCLALDRQAALYERLAAK